MKRPIVQAPGCLGIVSSILARVDPAAAVARAGSSLNLDRDWVLIAVGKAAPAMAKGLLGVCGRAPEAALTIVPEELDVGGLPGEVVRSDHPLPTARSVHAGDRLCRVLEETPRLPTMVLLSGGASSLIARPRTPEIGLDDYSLMVAELLRAGASIRELNTVRKRMDLLKGGRLALRLRGRPVEVLVLSDVVGDDLSVIASGPISPDPTTPRDALSVLSRYGLDGENRVASAIRAMIATGERDTPDPGDPAFDRIAVRVVAGNGTAVKAAAEALRAAGVADVATRTGVAGEASVVARELCEIVRSTVVLPGQTRGWVWGGETTVTVRGPGRGGRNQELALASAIALDELPGAGGVMVVSLGTDGVDGPTDAAGAVVTGETAARSRALGLDPAAALSANDSHGFFVALERAGVPCLIRTGPTGTNVGDVIFATHS